MWVWRVNNKRLLLPTDWSEMITKDYQRIKGVTDTTTLGLFSALTGIPFDHIAEIRDEELSNIIYQICAFITNTPEYFRDFPTPESITVCGKRVALSKQLEKMTLEQNIMVRSKMDEVKYLEELISFACAVYLQPHLDGEKFNADRVPYWQAHIDVMPIEYTFPVGFFLLTRIKNSGTIGRHLLPHRIILSMIMRLKQRRRHRLINSKRLHT